MKNLILLLTLLLCLNGFSQTKPTDIVDVKNLDIEFLELLTLEKINQFRKENNLKTSLVGSQVKRFTKIHSNNMMKSKSLFHSKISQNDIIRLECCHYSYFVSNRHTYEEKATFIVNSWKESKQGHRELLLLDYEYGYVGISISDKSIDTDSPYVYHMYVTYQASDID